MITRKKFLLVLSSIISLPNVHAHQQQLTGPVYQGHAPYYPQPVLHYNPQTRFYYDEWGRAYYFPQRSPTATFDAPFTPHSDSRSFSSGSESSSKSAVLTFTVDEQPIHFDLKLKWDHTRAFPGRGKELKQILEENGALLVFTGTNSFGSLCRPAATIRDIDSFGETLRLFNITKNGTDYTSKEISEASIFRLLKEGLSSIESLAPDVEERITRTQALYSQIFRTSTPEAAAAEAASASLAPSVSSPSTSEPSPIPNGEMLEPAAAANPTASKNRSIAHLPVPSIITKAKEEDHVERSSISSESDDTRELSAPTSASSSNTSPARSHQRRLSHSFPQSFSTVVAATLIDNATSQPSPAASLTAKEKNPEAENRTLTSVVAAIVTTNHPVPAIAAAALVEEKEENDPESDNEVAQDNPEEDDEPEVVIKKEQQKKLPSGTSATRKKKNKKKKSPAQIQAESRKERESDSALETAFREAKKQREKITREILEIYKKVNSPEKISLVEQAELKEQLKKYSSSYCLALTQDSKEEDEYKLALSGITGAIFSSNGEFEKMCPAIFRYLFPDGYPQDAVVLDLRETAAAAMATAGPSTTGPVSLTVKVTTPDEVIRVLTSIQELKSQGSRVKMTISTEEQLAIKTNFVSLLESVNADLYKTFLEIAQFNIIDDTALISALDESIHRRFPENTFLKAQIRSLQGYLGVQKNLKDFLTSSSIETFGALYRQCSQDGAVPPITSSELTPLIVTMRLPASCFHTLSSDIKRAKQDSREIIMTTLKYANLYFQSLPTVTLRHVFDWCLLPSLNSALTTTVDDTYKTEAQVAILDKKLTELSTEVPTEEDIKAMIRAWEEIIFMNNSPTSEAYQTEIASATRLVPVLERMRRFFVENPDFSYLCNLIQLSNSRLSLDERTNLLGRCMERVNNNEKLSLEDKDRTQLYFLERIYTHWNLSDDERTQLFRDTLHKLSKRTPSTPILEETPLCKIPEMFKTLTQSAKVISCLQTNPTAFMISDTMQKKIFSLALHANIKQNMNFSISILLYVIELLKFAEKLAKKDPRKDTLSREGHIFQEDVLTKAKWIYDRLHPSAQVYGMFYNPDILRRHNLIPENRIKITDC